MLERHNNQSQELYGDLESSSDPNDKLRAKHLPGGSLRRPRVPTSRSEQGCDTGKATFAERTAFFQDLKKRFQDLKKRFQESNQKGTGMGGV